MSTFFAATLAGCFSDKDEITDPSLDFVSCDTGAPAPPSNARLIRIRDFAFGSGALTVPAGTTVYWINCDADAHTTTSDTGVWGSTLLAQNAVFSRRFDNAGTYPYHCQPHATFMTASLTVQ
jgi:plastocyanin